jgi:hypothetical protein
MFHQEATGRGKRYQLYLCGDLKIRPALQELLFARPDNNTSLPILPSHVNLIGVHNYKDAGA